MLIYVQCNFMPKFMATLKQREKVPLGKLVYAAIFRIKEGKRMVKTSINDC